jgi:transposase
MNNHIQIPLDLPDVRILEVSKTEQEGWLIRVESTVGSATCHKCGQKITEFHAMGERLLVRHLPLFEIPVRIELRPKRYRCPDCDGGPTTTEQPDWYQRRSPNTKAYEQWLLRLLINSTVTDVARKLNVSEDTVSGVLDRWVETAVDWSTFLSIAVIGIDEISVKRGHRDYIAIVTTKTATGVVILGVLGDRKKETVLAFLESIPESLKATVETVCTDMYQGYVNAVAAVLPQAKIVVDRFHVAQVYRKSADAVRKRELRRLKQELPESKYALLKGLMWAFRKRPQDLNPAEKVLLNRAFFYSPEMETAYGWREELTNILDQPYSKEEGKRAIAAWSKRVSKRGIAEFTDCLKTLHNWLDEITNYFLERHSSGFVEGFNNRIKVMKRRCYGIFKVNRIFQRLTLDLHGYQRFGSVLEQVKYS